MSILLNLRDINFVDSLGSCRHKRPRHVLWDRTCASDAPVIVTDRYLLRESTSREECGWLVEPEAIVPEVRAQLPAIAARYARVFTSNTDLIDAHPTKYAFVPASGIWIRRPFMHSKTQSLSMFVSWKARTEGHRLRLAWADRLCRRADVFGLGRPVRFKETGLVPYRFSVAIENSREPGYFTEKLLDCFATGTIPVYWVCPNVERFFDVRGIIPLTNDFDPCTLSCDLYERLLPYAHENFRRACAYEIPDDYLAQTYFKDAVQTTAWCRFRGRTCTNA